MFGCCNPLNHYSHEKDELSLCNYPSPLISTIAVAAIAHEISTPKIFNKICFYDTGAQKQLGES